jgi:3-oxoacyl-[acyl-carrier-protein] synthase II
MGVVTPAGIGIDEFWQAMLAGRQAVRTVSLFDATGFPCCIGGELEGFSAGKYVPKSYRKSVKVMARDIEIAVASADLAFRDSKLTTRGIEPGKEDIDSKRLGCNIGAGLICADLNELGAAVTTAVTDGKFDLKKWGSSGMENLTPLWLLKYLPNMLACHVTIIHGCEGPSNNITCGDASGHLGIGESARWISRGEADVVIAGGAEGKLNPMGLLRQHLLGRVVTGGNNRPEQACRPFDAQHSGTVVAEGGGLVVLEELDRARARGAKIYAEVVGSGSACDPAGIDVTTPMVGGLDLAIRKAMDNAGVGPEDVDLIVAHGTGVPGEDRLEAQAWHDALGGAAEGIPAFVITGSIGSLFAGAGGVEVAAAAMAISTQAVPPAVNFAAADGCSLNLKPQARTGRVGCAVTAAFTTGGQSAAVVLRRYQE